MTHGKIRFSRAPGRRVGVAGPQAGNLLSAEAAAPQVRAAFGRLERASMCMLGVRQFRRLIVIPAGS